MNLYLSLRPPGLAHLSSLLQYVAYPESFSKYFEVLDSFTLLLGRWMLFVLIGLEIFV